MTQLIPDPPQAEAEATGSPEPASRRRFAMTRRRWVVGGLVLVLALGGGVAWFLLRPQADARAQSMTRSVTATLSTQTVTVGLSGTLSPQSQAALSFSVPGTVTKVHVKVGDTVTKGQQLARIDDGSLQDALDLAKANLDTAEANLDDTDDSGTSAAIAAAQAQVRSAKAAVASAKADLADAVLRSTIAGTIASVDLSVGDTVTSSSGSGSSGSNAQAATTATTSTAQVLVISTHHLEARRHRRQRRPGQPPGRAGGDDHSGRRHDHHQGDGGFGGDRRDRNLRRLVHLPGRDQPVRQAPRPVLRHHRGGHHQRRRVPGRADRSPPRPSPPRTGRRS